MSRKEQDWEALGLGGPEVSQSSQFEKEETGAQVGKAPGGGHQLRVSDCLHTNLGPAPSPRDQCPPDALGQSPITLPGSWVHTQLYYIFLIPLYPQCLAWCCAHMTSVKMPGTLEKE